MMIKAGFTPEMLELLRSLKGKVFKSYECNFIGCTNVVSKGLRINLGRSSLDLFMTEKAVPYFGALEDMSFLECKSAVSGSQFPFCHSKESSNVYLVDEKIIGVEVITDNVEYKFDDYGITLGMGVILRTQYHTFVFSRGKWFSDFIRVEKNDPENIVQIHDSIDSLWLNNKPAEEAAEEGIVVTRTVEVL